MVAFNSHVHNTSYSSSHTCKYHGREYMRIVHTHTDRLETHSRGTHVREHTLSQLTQKEGEHYEDRLRCWRACCRVPVLHCSWMLSWNKNNEGWISICPALPVPTGTLRFFFFMPHAKRGQRKIVFLRYLFSFRFHVFLLYLFLLFKIFFYFPSILNLWTSYIYFVHWFLYLYYLEIVFLLDNYIFWILKK